MHRGKVYKIGFDTLRKRDYEALIIAFFIPRGTGYTLTSIQKCIKKFGQYLSTPYVMHTKDVEQKDGLVYLPLYMTGLL